MSWLILLGIVVLLLVLRQSLVLVFAVSGSLMISRIKIPKF